MRAVLNVKNASLTATVFTAYGIALYFIKRLSTVVMTGLATLTIVLLCNYAHAEQQKPEKSRAVLKLEVIDSFIEIRTGPGRGYPIFHVIEQGEYIEVLTRRPDWYEIKARNGSVGWTPASQVSRTLEPSGEPVDLPTVSYGDYLKNSWRIGFLAGSFSSGELRGVDAFSFNLGYRPWSWIGLDLEAGNMYGVDIKGDYANANILIEPFSKWRFSPVLIWGTGSMKISSQPKLAPLEIGDSDFDTYGLGIHSYIGRNFVVRSEFRVYTVETDGNNERLDAWRIGFNTFF